MYATLVEGIHIGAKDLIIGTRLLPAHGVDVAVVIAQHSPRLLRQLLHQRAQVAVEFKVVVHQVAEEEVDRGRRRSVIV